MPAEFDKSSFYINEMRSDCLVHLSRQLTHLYHQLGITNSDRQSQFAHFEISAAVFPDCLLRQLSLYNRLLSERQSQNLAQILRMSFERIPYN